MIGKIEEVLVNNIPNEHFQQQFIQSRYNTVVYILKCYEENKELVQLLMNSSHSISFQMKLRETLKMIMVDKIFPKLEINTLTIPTDLFIMFFTSISLNLAEYAYQSDEPVDIKYLAKFLINIMVHGPAKTLGLIVDNNQLSILTEDDIQSFVKQRT